MDGMSEAAEREPPVEDLASEWGNILDAEAKTDSRVSVAGSERRASSPSSGGSVALVAPALTGKDLQPFVRALGSFACRIANVAPMTDAEAKEIAEPGAAVLSKYAPKVAEWVPELTLITKVGDFVDSRSAEFKRNREAAKTAAGTPIDGKPEPLRKAPGSF